MKIQTFIKEAIVLITVGDEFVMFSRNTNAEGFGGATFSISLNASLADRIDNSGIIKVESFNVDGILKYRALPFCTVDRLTNVFVDILQYVQNKEQ